MAADNQISIPGTLRNDGTLELHQKPAVAPGPVTVVVEPATSTPNDSGSIAETINRIKLRQQQRGYVGLDENGFAELERERLADDEVYDDQWPDPSAKG